MKKILIATTALVLVAGAASADVTIAGSGYFGLGYDRTGASATQGKTFLIDRFQLDFKASKTTDSGLTFHGNLRVRSQNNINPTSFNGGAVGVTAGGLDVSVGNVTDAYD
ncbi:MAG: porin, partial [Paracoccaceae bacterium]|nr:porin [Paracoccaceae bacterium]